jgi:hypothetical protein
MATEVQTGSGSGGSTAIVAIVAIVLLVALAFFVFRGFGHRGGGTAAPGGGVKGNVEINVPKSPGK